jgi:hypothetical protein
VAAFIGRASRGPLNTAVTCLGLADYERRFGALAADSAMSYQANGFFNNGGAQAEVVRLYRMPSVAIKATLAPSPVGGTYVLTLASLGSGPTVQVTTTVPDKPTPESIYNALALQLQTEPVLAGHVTNVSTSGALSFDLSYPCSVSGGGPDTWTFQLNGGTAAPSVSTGSGTAAISFTSGLTFTLQDLPPQQPQKPLATSELTLTPPGGAPVRVRVTAPPGGLSANLVALALYKGILQSTAARALVVPTNPDPSGDPAKATSTLALAYAAPVNVTLTQTAPTGTIPIVGTPLPAPPGLSFALSAANPGDWGNGIFAAIDTAGINQAVADKYGLKSADLFNLTVLCGGVSERFTAVTLAQKAGANRLDRVLRNGSNLVALTDDSLLGTSSPPPGAWGQGTGGLTSASLQDMDYLGDPNLKTGLYAFNQKPYGFNILCIPPDDTTDALGGDVPTDVYQQAAQICVENNAMLIIDPPKSWSTSVSQGNIESLSLDDLGSYTDAQARASAVYFPRVVIADPLRNGLPRTVVPSGFLAAVWASVDAASGVWKAPAGMDAPIGGILQLQTKLNDEQNGVLNPLGINALRFFSGAGSVVWGARTLRGADQLGDPYKYIPVQRLLDYIETSLLEDTRWAVFQPNGAALWAALQTQITVFMNGLFAQGAFAGTSAGQAYFVKCDATTTSAADAAAGMVNVQVGFAPLYPAEFVVITISQLTASSG